MMLKGDADVLMWATEQVADELKNEPGVAVSLSPNSRWVMRLFINLAAKGSTDPVADPNPFLSDVRVRQAIRSAIDVDIISGTIFLGYAPQSGRNSSAPHMSAMFPARHMTLRQPRPCSNRQAGVTRMATAPVNAMAAKRPTMAT